VTSNVNSLLRGLTILDVLAEAPDGVACLGEISRMTGLSPSTTHRLLATLVERGYVARGVGTKQYVIGHRMIHFSCSATQRSMRLRQIVRPHLESITAESGETSNLVVFEGKNVVYVDQVEGTKALRMIPGLGSTFPAYTSASAKAILAYQVDNAPLGVLFSAEPLTKHAKHTLIEKCEFEAAVRQVMTCGYAVEHDELAEGSSCIAAPIRSRNGVSIAAISVPGPTARVLHPTPERLGLLVMHHAQQVSAALGFRQLVPTVSGKTVVRREVLESQ
jgi:DNA-binding IclR family transcriptional regulator